MEAQHPVGLMDTDLVRHAYTFAAQAHGAINHVRKYTGEPYITHPLAVARLVQAVDCGEEAIAAALLHDVLEDTPTTAEQLRAAFGHTITELVLRLTDISRPGDGNRAVRKQLDRDHIAQAPPVVKTIKLADLINNTQSIVAHDPKFARVYLAEKALLLTVLKEGDTELWVRASALLAHHSPHLAFPQTNASYHRFAADGRRLTSGQWYGYPACCEQYFQSGLRASSTDTELACGFVGTGYRVCPDCQSLTAQQIYDTIVANRHCPTPFPIRLEDLEVGMTMADLSGRLRPFIHAMQGKGVHLQPVLLRLIGQYPPTEKVSPHDQ
jgi:hypothetical protein